MASALKKKFLACRPIDLSPLHQANGKNSSELATEITTLAYQKKSYSYDWTYLRRSGDTFPAEVLSTRLTLEDKEVLHTTLWDISKRKQIEDALKTSEKRLQRIGATTRNQSLPIENNSNVTYLDTSPNRNKRKE